MSILKSAVESQSRPTLSADEALRLVQIVDLALHIHRLEELTASVLPAVADTMQSPAALLYVSDERMPAPSFLARR